MSGRPWLCLLFPVLVGAAPPDSSSVPLRMRTHWRLAASMETELIRGNLDVVRTMAGRLADLPPEELPSELRGPLEQLRLAAGAVENADDIDQAAVAVAQLGATCASCHMHTNRGPSDHPRSVPPEGWDERRMTRHQWAADWMWLGLIAPSQSAWDRGATELARAPLLDADTPRLPGFAQLESDVLSIAARAVGQTDPVDRAKLTGELLAACATCHRLVDEGEPQTSY